LFFAKDAKEGSCVLPAIAEAIGGQFYVAPRSQDPLQLAANAPRGAENDDRHAWFRPPVVRAATSEPANSLLVPMCSDLQTSGTQPESIAIVGPD